MTAATVVRDRPSRSARSASAQLPPHPFSHGDALDSPSPTLWCSPGVHLVRIDDDILILDVAADQYHCLPGAPKDLRIGADGRLTAAQPGVLADLAILGLATHRRPTRLRTGITAAARDLTPAASPPRWEIVRAGLGLAAATVAFRGKSLADLVARDVHTGPDVGPVDEARLARLVGAARAARPWIPFEGECLPRSFKLRAILARRGVRLDWIFGVRTWPFGAHCWLQTGDLVVGDRLERVGRYTPILKA